MRRAGSVRIIAEAGVNHNGSLRLALRLVDAARRAGADAVKFQTFRTEDVVTRSAPMAAYQRRNLGRSGSQWEMIRRLELSEADHRRLAERCRRAGIEFMSTPFDARSVDLLVRLGVKRLKVPSGEITNAPLLLRIARTRLPLVVSTGMSTMDEVRAALGVLCWGWTSAAGDRPSRAAFAKALKTGRSRKLLRDRVTLLHCTTQYPAPAEEANLRAMGTLREEFGTPVGLSDHTPGIAVSIAAVALGASVIEKHLTLDKKLPGPDHKASLDPAEMAQLVLSARQVSGALGDGRKRPADCELSNRLIARRSLVAARDIRRGQILGPQDLAAKRPSSGVSPFRYWDLLGRKADRDYRADDRIRA
ncbi:MAG: N,N'-diacetyllegionaminic acid synthase [Candidatus Omnitrophica bacterium]|nr:N,N'-diacetyllegionaminic acid synthase [Candidatus Omnitrophota bacterium]